MKANLFKVTIKKVGLGIFNRLNTMFRERLLLIMERESVALTGRIIRNNLSQSSSGLRQGNRYSIGQRTGRLAANTRPITRWMGYGVTGGTTIGEGVPYTHVHVGQGGEPPITITPKRAKALTIPLKAALDSRGVLRSEYNVGSLRSIPGLFARDGVLYKRTGPKGKGVLPLFLLRRSVRIEKSVSTDAILSANERLIRDNFEVELVKLVGEIRGLRVY